MTTIIPKSSFFVEKQFGPWTNLGDCKPIFKNQSCGLGYQFHRRQCFDGAEQRCSFSDTDKISLCSKYDCPRIITAWQNVGECRAEDNEIVTCGDGIQTQIRNCTNGTSRKCSDIEIQRNVSCLEAGLPQSKGMIK